MLLKKILKLINANNLVYAIVIVVLYANYSSKCNLCKADELIVFHYVLQLVVIKLNLLACKPM